MADVVFANECSGSAYMDCTGATMHQPHIIPPAGSQPSPDISTGAGDRHHGSPGESRSWRAGREPVHVPYPAHPRHGSVPSEFSFRSCSFLSCLLSPAGSFPCSRGALK